jgi:5,5'-dehydrodivanillate O-demethylase
VLSQHENQVLTQVGPGTPAGQLLRCYWHPVAVAAEVPRGGVRPVRLLGENFALFRSESGDLAMTEARCPHRGASLALGFVDDDRLRCSYHGWAFDAGGRCVETPNEPRGSRLRDLASVRSVPVVERGGLVFAHLGSQTPDLGLLGLSPLSGRGRINIRHDVIACNWLQIAENGLDPTHLEWLHGHLPNAIARSAGEPEPFEIRAHDELSFEYTANGVVKRRRLVGETNPGEDWTIGQQVVFPGILYHANATSQGLQFRTPVDDHHTLHFWWEIRESEPDEIVVRPSTVRGPDGEINLTSLDGQDVAIWLSQGPILDRTQERLGAADHGISLLRKLLLAQMQRVKNGEAPLNSGSTNLIDLPRRTETTPVLNPR